MRPYQTPKKAYLTPTTELEKVVLMWFGEYNEADPADAVRKAAKEMDRLKTLERQGKELFS